MSFPVDRWYSADSGNQFADSRIIAIAVVRSIAKFDKVVA